jgi:arsenite methyltransferase
LYSRIPRTNAASNPTDGSECCDNPPLTALPVVSCCSTGPAGSTDLHARLSDLLARYDVNEYAASVKVYAVKP